MYIEFDIYVLIVLVMVNVVVDVRVLIKIV